MDISLRQYWTLLSTYPRPQRFWALVLAVLILAPSDEMQKLWEMVTDA